MTAPLFKANAGTDIYFTVVNDSLLDLSDDTMPVKIGEVFYVPLSVFTQYSLSTYGLYDREKRTATIYSDNHTLNFEFGSGNTYDETGKVYPFWAIYYNSGVYVPAVWTCQFFGFRFSVYSNSISTFIRIRSSSSTSDDEIARLGAIKMQSMLNKYQDSHYTPSPTPKPSTSYAPVTPTPTIPTQDPDKRYAYVYLSIRGIGENTPSILNSLSYYGYRAMFFVTADEIAGNPDLIRRIAGSGHGIGIVCTEALYSDYSRAAALLREAARLKTVIITLDCSYTEDLGKAASDAGLIIWGDSYMPVYGFNISASTYTISRIIENANGRLDLSFNSSSASLLKAALSDISDKGYPVALINETTKTYLNGV
jgi:Predicted xylanase/chitin deacetylase